MFKLKSKATNIRPAKDDFSGIIVTPSSGIMRVTGSLARTLGLTEENKVIMHYVEPEEGKTKDAAGRSYMAMEVSKDGSEGAKLGFANGKNSGSLQFSSKNVWLELGGSEEESVFYKIDAENPAMAPTEEDPDAPTVFFLEFVKTEEKTVRASSSKEGEEEEEEEQED